MFKSLIFLSAFGLSAFSFANNVELEHFEDQQPLQSLRLLQSIHHIPEQQDYVLPNIQELANKHQVRTLFAYAPQLPIVDIQLSFNAGSARDEEIAKGLFGLANMTAQLMDEGTARYTALEVAQILEDNGAQLSIQAHRDMFLIKLRVLADAQKIETVTELVLDLINHANFQNKSIDLMLNNTAVGQQQLQENPSRLMSVRFYRALYAKHPYAEPITGTQGSIKRILPEHLKQFRDRFLVRHNLNIAITGQLSEENALKLSQKISSQLKAGEKAKNLPDIQVQPQLDIIHLPYQSTQAHVMLGHIGTVRHDQDRIALEIANRMLGNSSFNSILMQELRVKRGYTYGVNSSFSFPQSQGIFSISYSTQQAHLMESLAVTHQSLVNFIQQPINEQLLAETKLGMLRAFPNQFSSNAALNAQLGSLGFYQESAQSLQNYQQNVQQITAQQVHEAVKRHIHPDRLTVIVVSPELDQDQLKNKLSQTLNPDVLQENDVP